MKAAIEFARDLLCIDEIDFDRWFKGTSLHQFCIGGTQCTLSYMITMRQGHPIPVAQRRKIILATRGTCGAV